MKQVIGRRLTQIGVEYLCGFFDFQCFSLKPTCKLRMSLTDRGALLVMPRQTDRGSQDVRALGAGPGGCKKYDSGDVKKIEQI